MADTTDAGSSPNSSSRPDRDWYAQQWRRLCEEVNASDPTEALARVQALKREANRSGSDDEEGLVTVSEVEEVFREMNQKVEKLRERNAALVERLEENGDDMEAPFRDLHQKAEQLLDTLDAATMEEARTRIQKLNRRLESLYREKEALAQAGLSDAEAALAELDRLRDERDALQEERDRLQATCDQLRQELEAAPDSDAELDASTRKTAALIRDEMGLSTPDQAEAFARLIAHLHERVQERAAAYGAAVDDAPDDAVETLHSIAAHLDALPPPDALPQSAADALGVSTASEARTLTDTLRRVGTRIVEHYKTVVEFEDVDPDADDAQTLLRTLDDRLRALPEEVPAPSNEALPPEVGEVLGIRSVEDARELDAMIADLSDRLDRLSQEHEKLEEAGLTVDTALTMLENMDAQLTDLYHNSDPASGADDGEEGLAPSLRRQALALIDADPAALDDATQLVRRLADRLSNEQHVLAEAGLSDAEEAVATIEQLKAKLDAPSAPSPDADAAERLAAIEDVLGISTREEAEELSQIARQMEEQLTVVYQEKEKLEELGLSSIEDAVAMIENMESQLDELYEDKESLRKIRSGGTEEQSTFQQLEALYAERERLQQALGVSSATEVIELVESLNVQLDELYQRRDAEVDPDERHDVQLWEPETDDASSAEDAPAAAPSPSADDAEAPDPTLTLTSMEHQLESLYREKETLLHHGLSNAQEAVSQLQTQQKQLDVLQRENHAYQQRLDRLQSELGTANVSQIVALVDTLTSEADVRLDEVRPASAPDESPEYGLDIEAASPFVDPDTLDQLDEMDPDALDALDVGAVRLSDDGTVETLNEAALQLPGLSGVADRSAVVGANFFFDLAPSTTNNLFYGRFQEGKRRGTLDARFPYTFTSPDEEAQSFAVHLYRTPDSDSTWLLYRPT